jgi:hypothetical protein
VGVIITFVVPRETELRECTNLLQLRPAIRGITTPSKLQRLQSCKIGIIEQKETVGNNNGVSTEDVPLKIHNSVSIIGCCSSQIQSAASAATITTNKISGWSVQAKNVNINAMDVFLAFDMVQQIMTEFIGAVTEREMIAVLTKAVFKLLKNNTNNSSQTSENHSIQCQQHWEADT